MPLIQWIMQNLQSGRVQGSATLIGDSSVVAVAKVTWHAITVIDGDSSINATAKVTPHPAPQPQFDRYSLGVTYGPPGGGGFGIRQSKRSILIKFN